MKVLLLLVLACSTVSGDVGVRRRRSPFLGKGLRHMSTMVKAKGNLISSGVTTAVGQAVDLTAAGVKIAATAVDKGTQMTMQAISAVSGPAANAMAVLMTKNINLILGQTGQDVVKIPGLKKSLYGLGSIDLADGTFSRLSTLSNNGTVTLNMTTNGIIITLPVSLGEMKVDFPSYRVSTWMLNLNGSITVTVASNRLIVHLRLMSIKDCAITIDKVEVTDFDGIEVQLTGLCGWCSAIANYIIRFLQGIIKYQVQAGIDDQLHGFSFGNVVMCAPLRPMG